VGGDPNQALPLAAAIQLIHDFSLIHDDIEDNSSTRRGRPTVWKLWGVPQAINTGDGLFTIAHLALHRLADAGVAPEVTVEVLRRFGSTILTLCEGQFLDLSYEGNLRITEDDYLAMIRRKTAVLLGASTELGALVGGADATTVRALADFGLNLGMAFQIQDDVLGVWGDPEKTGKPFAADLVQRKLSLPVIHALNSAQLGEQLAELYARRETADGDITRMLEILDQAGSRSHTERAAEQYQRAALAALDRAQGDAQALAGLRALAGNLVGRTR